MRTRLKIVRKRTNSVFHTKPWFDAKRILYERIDSKKDECMIKQVASIGFGLFLLCAIPLYARLLLSKQPRPLSFTVSIIIPCVPGHVIHLKELLSAYAQQTVIPNEVVVSLSDCNKASKAELNALTSYPWPFDFKIIKTKHKCAAGTNRNKAFAHSIGDIIVAQDADDIPHPQKIEIIKYIFEHYKVEHLLHAWTPTVANFKPYAVAKLNAHYQRRIENNTHCVHHGNVCALRKVCKRVKWPSHFENGEDAQFNQLVYAYFHRTVILDANLIAYRSEFSSWLLNLRMGEFYQKFLS